jgi:superfamily II DNA/RNA helicase
LIADQLRVETKPRLLMCRRIALFSATMPPRVEELARTVLHDPVRIHIGERNAAALDVEQKPVTCQPPTA